MPELYDMARGAGETLREQSSDVQRTVSSESSGSSGQCPIRGWEQARIAFEVIKGASFNIAWVAAKGILNRYLVGPIWGGVGDLIDSGRGVYEGIVENIGNLYNSISPRDWALYAMGAMASEIGEAAKREEKMLTTIKAYMSSCSKKTSSITGGNYASLSRLSSIRVKQILMAIDRAIAAESEMAMYMRVGDAGRRADANAELLSLNMERYRKYQKSLAGNLEDLYGLITGEGKEGEPIKSSEVATLLSTEAISTIITGASNRARAAIMSDAKLIIDRYMMVARIVYMYSGVNFMPAVKELLNEYESIIESVKIQINPDGSTTMDVPGGNDSDIDEMIGSLSVRIKQIAGDAIREIFDRSGLYIMSMSPDYDILSTLTYDINGEQEYLFGIDELSRGKRDALAAAMNAAPFSSASANTLTIYGTNLKIPSTVALYNAVCDLLSGILEVGDQADRADTSLAKMNGIASKLTTIRGNVDIEAYEFDGPVGLGTARADAMRLRTSLKSLINVRVSRAREESSSYETRKEMYRWHPLEIKTHEPVLGTTIAMGFALNVLLSPLKVSRSITNAVTAIIDDRIKYLRYLMEATKMASGYSDPSCDEIIKELENSGFGIVANNIKYGLVVTGAVSVVGAVAGTTLGIFDIVGGCLFGQEVTAKMWVTIQRGVRSAKSAAKTMIDKAIDVAMRPLGYGKEILDTARQRMAEIERLKSRLNDLSSYMENATGKNIDNQDVPM